MIWYNYKLYRLLQLVDLPMLDMLRSYDLRSHDLGEITMYSNSKRPRLNDSCDLPQNILTAMKYLENRKYCSMDILCTLPFGEFFIKKYLVTGWYTGPQKEILQIRILFKKSPHFTG